ncbi:MAG: beta-ribofuranosylaminobenzene 5'-phosphate synthase family protein [Sulfolobales archaeon]
MREIEIRSVSRIHITLIDLNGTWGLIDGGAGLVLEEPYFLTSVRESDRDSIEFLSTCDTACCEEIKRVAQNCLDRTKRYLRSRSSYNIRFKRFYPPHIGLGSTTQLCLSVAVGVWLIERGETPSIVELARIVRRGGTSGIGVYGFAMGGFIIDGGHLRDVEKRSFLPSDYSEAPPPVLLERADIPDKWRFILVRPRTAARIYGSRELSVFQDNTPLDIREVYEVSYHVFMGLLNAVKRGNITMFKRHLRRIQDIGFKSVEWKIQDESIIRLARHLDRERIEYGLSSMGPTIFIPVLEEETEETLKKINNLLPGEYILELSRGRNRGFEFSLI